MSIQSIYSPQSHSCDNSSHLLAHSTTPAKLLVDVRRFYSPHLQLCTLSIFRNIRSAEGRVTSASYHVCELRRLMSSSITITKLTSGITYLRARASEIGRPSLQSSGDSRTRESHRPYRATVHTETSSQSDSPLFTPDHSWNGSSETDSSLHTPEYSQNGSSQLDSESEPVSVSESVSESVEQPPPLMLKLSPYARVSLPAMYRRAPKIHSLLTPEGSKSLIWRLCMPPSTASFALGQSRRRDQYHWTAIPATNVANLISLTIRVEPFPTPVVVMPAPHSGRISVYDVLAAVYTGARRCAMEMGEVNQGAKMQMNWAGPPAYTAGQSADEDATCQDVRMYMDFRTRWVGLVPSGDDPDVWVVRTKLTMDQR